MSTRCPFKVTLPFGTQIAEFSRLADAARFVVGHEYEIKVRSHVIWRGSTKEAKYGGVSDPDYITEPQVIGTCRGRIKAMPKVKATDTPIAEQARFILVPGGRR